MSEIKTAGSQRYDVPRVDGDVYKTENSTIADGVTNRQVTLTGLTRFTGLEIVNGNTTVGDNLIVRLNNTANDQIIVRPGKSKEIRDFVMTSVYISNSSGNTITYEINAYGVTA